MQNKSEMLGLIHLIADCHETEISDSRVAMIEHDLQGYSVAEVNQAWKKYRSVPTNLRMPTAAQLIQLIPDGHPSAQESFAMLPRDEYASVIWSDEMRFAYGVCEPLIREGNLSGAFFAYKEEYERLVNEARMNRKKPKWSPSFGDDKHGRITAVVHAVEKKRISLEYACAIYPELEFNPAYKNLALKYGGNVPEIDHDGLEKVKLLINKTEKK